MRSLLVQYGGMDDRTIGLRFRRVFWKEREDGLVVLLPLDQKVSIIMFTATIATWKSPGICTICSREFNPVSLPTRQLHAVRRCAIDN